MMWFCRARRLRAFIAVTALIAMGGCAWARVRVDIYDGGDQPRLDTTTLAADLDRVGAEANSYADQRKEVAGLFVAMLESLSDLAGGQIADLSSLSSSYELHVKEIDRRVEGLKEAVTAAKTSTAALDDIPTASLKYQNAVDTASRDIGQVSLMAFALGKPVEDSFSKTMHHYFDSGLSGLQGAYQLASDSETTNVSKKEFDEGVSAAYKALAVGLKSEAEQNAWLTTRIEALNTLANSRGSGGSLPNGDTPIDDLLAPQAAGQPNAAFDAAAAIHSNFFSPNRFDHIQNPADPRLRCISTPRKAGENAANKKLGCHPSLWNKRAANSKFYAEGKSGLVLVRDRLGHYRFQKVENDPEALVTGSLKIARATSDAAVKIAAASGGVPIPGSTESEARTSASSTATDSAAVKAKAATRAAQRREMIRQISELIGSLEDGDLKAEDRARVAATLRGYGRLLKPDSTPAQRDKP